MIVVAAVAGAELGIRDVMGAAAAAAVGVAGSDRGVTDPSGEPRYSLEAPCESPKRHTTAMEVAAVDVPAEAQHLPHVSDLAGSVLPSWCVWKVEDDSFFRR